MHLWVIVSLLAGIAVANNAKPPGFGQRPATWITYNVSQQFDNPVGLARPYFRYWVPDADVEDNVLQFDLKQMKEHGAGGAEIICLENYGIEDAVVDPALYGYGGARWYQKFNTILHAIKALNMTADFALGPTQGASIPILDPDTKGMNTELAYGQVNLTSGQTYDGWLPQPKNTDAGYANKPDFYPPLVNYTNKFVSAIVARKSKIPSDDPRVVQLDYHSVQDVTARVSNGSIRYTAPTDGGEYILFAFWQRRTGYLAAQGAFNNATNPNNPASWFAYVVDHFSQAGTDLWTSFTEQYVMSGENADLIRELGIYAWEDSAEFRATLFWTDNFINFFQESRNYSPIAALPSYFGTTNVPPSTLPDSYYYFGFNDEGGKDISAKLRNDYRQTLQELYEKYHLTGLSTWTSKWDLQGSLQPYATAPILAPAWDLTASAAYIDAPETESNYFDGVIDANRAFSGGAFLGRRQIVSSELGAHRYEAYAITWPVILNDCKISYAGGVNRVVLHGYPYSGYRPDASWPGFTTFEWLYSEMWGPRQPGWQYSRVFGDWIARTQLILQTGVPRVDIAIYRHKYIDLDIKHYGLPENIFGDPSLANSGYSYVALSPSLLKLDNAIITEGVLAKDGPAFSAFIIDNSTNLTSEAASRFIEYAEEGFPIIFINGVPESTPYYCPTCDEYVKETVTKLLQYPSVKNVSSESEVVSALQDLKIFPAARNISPSPILYVHRWDENNKVDYFWVYNSDIYNDHETEVSIKANGGIPYQLNAWTGEITAVLNYSITDDNRYNLWVPLRSNQSTIFAFAPEEYFPDTPIPPVHVTRTDIHHLAYSSSENCIVARIFDARDHSITLSNGNIRYVPSSPSHILPRDATILGPWNLTIQEWLPGPNPTKNYTSIYKYHNYYDLQPRLFPWYNISSSLFYMSGIGTYTTQFSWSVFPVRNSSFSAGVLLSLPRPIFNTAQIHINENQTAPIDVDDPVVNISPFLRNGTNTVRIEVSSTLRNRLLEFNNTQSWEQSQYAASYGPQPYGLVGEVELVPFWEVKLPL
ncbi:CAZyme family GH106 [Paecilomyces variotii]|nr:CAZyme family GH106 [Paecilomyces variotii]KAJ9363338.1 CAZyme family GH106 [Paecilomyces variotii]KAJ9387524.1 CAZyme family GH106 [Paecilomyces variotii]